MDGRESDSRADGEDDADSPVPRWGTTANPNTAEGEVQAMSAFARAAVHATGWRRTAARVAALLALVFIASYLIAALVIAAR